VREVRAKDAFARHLHMQQRKTKYEKFGLMTSWLNTSEKKRTRTTGKRPLRSQNRKKEYEKVRANDFFARKNEQLNTRSSG